MLVSLRHEHGQRFGDCARALGQQGPCWREGALLAARELLCWQRWHLGGCCRVRSCRALFSLLEPLLRLHGE